MAATIDLLLAEALTLSDDSRIDLAERLYSSVPDDARLWEHPMDLIRTRMAEVSSGKVTLIDGEEGMSRIRAAAARE